MTLPKIKPEVDKISLHIQGQLAEWSKAHAWNACIGQPI